MVQCVKSLAVQASQNHFKPSHPIEEIQNWLLKVVLLSHNQHHEVWNMYIWVPIYIELNSDYENLVSFLD